MMETEEKVRKTVRQTFVLELLSIAITEYMVSEAYGSEKIAGNLRNITYYAHQNCINLFGLMLTRLQSEMHPMPNLDTLVAVVQNRKGYLGKRREHLVNLNQCNGLILGILKGLCRMCLGTTITATSNPNPLNVRIPKQTSVKPIYTVVSDILKRVDKNNVNVFTIREQVQGALKKSLLILQKQGYAQILPGLPSSDIKPPYLPPLNELDNFSKTVDNRVVESKKTEEKTESSGTNKTMIENVINTTPNNDNTGTSQNKKVYTLVLDLDETLVHYVEINGEGKVLVRPGAEKFLEELSQYYEIIVFTAAMSDVFFIFIFTINSMQIGLLILLILQKDL